MKQFLFLLVFIVFLGCMNTKQSRAKRDNPPEKFFEGKDLRMGEAIYSDNTRDIEGLIKNQYYDVNGRGNKISEGRLQRFTYLVYSVLIGEVEQAAKLLELGADANLVSFDEGGVYTAINLACSNKNKRMVELLLQYKVNLNPPLSSSPIYNLLKCTIADLSKMTSGFDWKEDYYFPLNLTLKAYCGKNMNEVILNRKFITPSNTEWENLNGNTQLLEYIIT